jgi:hypothetical protein
MRHELLPFLAAAVVTGCAPAPQADPTIGAALGRCTYVNGFSNDLECREYLGSNWTTEAMQDNCAGPMPGSDPGLFEADLGCDKAEILAQCVVDAGTVEAYTIVFPDGPDATCSGLQVGCNFAGGEYVPAAACGGEDPIDPIDIVPFTWPEQVCVDPLPGEPAGQGPDGQVCTWEVISASTEEGRHYADYASCEPVYTQRPYWSAPAEANTPANDPRYSDEEYQEDLAWVTGQVEASACVCCHSTASSPEGGTSGWFIEADGIWIDTLDDDGLAMMAGWIDSTAFGAWDPADNNGFAREITGMPSTQPLRMKTFLEGELARRGLSEYDFADAEPFGGPLADQLAYEPTDCPDGIGVNAAGEVRWNGGPARYLYVLEADSANPLVPPNLDLPDGTIWRVEVPPAAEAFRTGIVYGDIPVGGRQGFPQDGTPEPLVRGQEYYLYALMDMALPLSRCLFVAQ